jgi:hypothetical protein
LLKSLERSSMATSNEEVHVNNIGAGAIDGAGVGPNGEPGVPKKRKRPVIGRTFKRFKEYTNGGRRR